ncbi:MAG: nitric oxide reductase, partial [Pseudomonadota bacterium]|nr:nitric oxide reductase [Pseudomonadota bacterium]
MTSPNLARINTRHALAEPRDQVSSVLKWILLTIVIFTFAAFGWATVITYRQAPPQPAQFVTQSGHLIMTKKDIIQGKAAFQQADLMDYGSLYGMGSYFGEDYTAQYLVSLGKITETNLAHQIYHEEFSRLSPARQIAVQKQMQTQLQSVSLLHNKISVIPDALAQAMTELQGKISLDLLTNHFTRGWSKAGSLNPATATQAADFLLYSSLTTVARRPGKSYSYTSNWPYEPLVGNTPTLQTFIWTWVSILWLLAALGLTLFLYKRFIETHEKEEDRHQLFKGFPELTPSQKKTGKYFLVVAAVFLLQIAAGATMAHDYAERTNFYGININSILPFEFLRSVHIQAPIIWIGLAWIGSALFIAPMIGGKEPKGQGKLVDLLFWVTLLIVGGALGGDYLGIQGVINQNWFWFGNQGLSYLELGRFWQIGFFIGLAFWSFLVLRAMLPTLKALGRGIRVEHILFLSTVNIAILYLFGMIPITGINHSFTITDFWR